MRIPTTMALLAILAMPQASLGAERATITDKQGRTIEVMTSGPDDAQAGVLVVHDWFGFTPFTEHTVDRLGDEGYRTIAVDLYQGRKATTHGEAEALMNGLDAAQAQDALAAGLDALDTRKVAVVGFSMGAKIALEAAIKLHERIAAAALIYGGGFGDLDDTALGVAGDLLVVSGSSDEWAHGELIALERRMLDLHHPIEAYVYPGVDHAFAQPLFNSGKNFDEDATKATETVMDGFLARHLGTTVSAK